MRYVGKKNLQCDCCGAHKYNAPAFDWDSMFDGRFLGTICQKCAIRELFGTNYRNNNRYKEWIKELRDI